MVDVNEPTAAEPLREYGEAQFCERVMAPAHNSGVSASLRIDSVATQIVMSSVRLLTYSDDGVESVATGFVYLTTLNQRGLGFLVTNKHVVDDASRLTICFLEADSTGAPRVGQLLTLDVADPAAHFHPHWTHDVAVMPLARVLGGIAPRQMGNVVIPSDRIPSEDELNDIEAVEEVLFAGYPSGLYDTENFTPIVRRGITATPIQLDYQGQSSFLIDAPVFAGSSGSAVFIHQQGSFRSKGTRMFGDRTFFVGVLSDQFKNVDKRDARLFMNLGLVLKPHLVEEAAQACSRGSCHS